MRTTMATGHRGQRPATPGRLPDDLERLVRQNRRRWSNAMSALAVLGAVGGVVAGLALHSILPLEASLSRVLWAVSVLAAVVGTYGVLILLVLIARLPVLEPGLGRHRPHLGGRHWRRRSSHFVGLPISVLCNRSGRRWMARRSAWLGLEETVRTSEWLTWRWELLPQRGHRKRLGLE